MECGENEITFVVGLSNIANLHNVIISATSIVNGFSLKTFLFCLKGLSKIKMVLKLQLTGAPEVFGYLYCRCLNVVALDLKYKKEPTK